MPIVSPQVLSLLVCDQIIVDRMTGKTSLIGMFGNIAARKFPMRQPQLCVFASLTDGRGKSPLELRIVDSDDARAAVVSGKATVEFKNPRAVACLNLHFNGLVFPEPGDYRVQLWSEGALLNEARLMLVLAKQRPQKDDESSA